MASVLAKSLAVLELMVEHPEGLQVSGIARQLDMPVSGVHRQLRELARLGYVRQAREQGDYALTLKLAALGLDFLGRSGVAEIAQPILDRLASKSGELIRLSVFDGSSLTWVAAAQGATTGLRYDPGRDQGMRVHPASTAAGRALLSTLSDDEVLALIGTTGLRPDGAPVREDAPTTIDQLQHILGDTRRQGYAFAIDAYIDGLCAMAVTVRAGGTSGGQVIGCLSITGPVGRLPQQRVEELFPALFDAAAELGAAAPASHFFTGVLKP